MTQAEIEQIQESWQSIRLLGDAAMRMFYRRLFAIDPSAHALFSQTDMTEQRRKFMETFDLVVKKIEHIEESAPLLEEMGRRHASYGVEDHHYDSVGAALMSMIETGMGQALTDEAQAAWASAYAHLSEPMRRAARAIDQSM